MFVPPKLWKFKPVAKRGAHIIPKGSVFPCSSGTVVVFFGFFGLEVTFC